MAEVYDVIIDLAKRVNARFDLEVAIPGREENLSDVKQWVPSDSVLLNLLLGNENQGYAEGRIFEIFGDNSHGKSTILQIMMNACQKAGGITHLLDSESGWSRERAEIMGHDSSRHMTIEVGTMEEGFEVIQELLGHYKGMFKDRVPLLFGWDTIAASPTRGEKVNDEFQDGMMYKARKIRQELRKLVKDLPAANASLMFLNQTIEGPKKGPGKGSGVKSTPGGGGIKFFSSQRLQVTRVATYQNPETKKPAGIISVCKLVKNKLGAPNKEIDLPINYAQGVDPVRESMAYLLDNTSIVNISGAYRKIVGFNDDVLSFYEKDTNKVLKENPGLVDWLRERVIAHWCGLE